MELRRGAMCELWTACYIRLSWCSKCPVPSDGVRHAAFPQGFSIAGSITPRDEKAEAPGRAVHYAARTSLAFAHLLCSPRV